MLPTRPPYPPELRRQTVELVRAGRSPAELAREFEPTAQTIQNWVRQADEGLRADGLTSDEREELRRLRRENKQLRIEREILSKVAAWVRSGDRREPEKIFAFVKAHQALCPIATQCRVLTHKEARLAIFFYIEWWYNPHRRHSSIAYHAPIAYEKLHLSQA